jgi:hypothetical protein
MAIGRLHLNAEERRALAMLADAGPSGYPKAALVLHGFAPWIVDDLVRIGLVKAQSATMRAGERSLVITRVRITDAGRRALTE